MGRQRVGAQSYWSDTPPVSGSCKCAASQVHQSANPPRPSLLTVAASVSPRTSVPAILHPLSRSKTTETARLIIPAPVLRVTLSNYSRATRCILTRAISSTSSSRLASTGNHPQLCQPALSLTSYTWVACAAAHACYSLHALNCPHPMTASQLLGVQSQLLIPPRHHCARQNGHQRDVSPEQQNRAPISSTLDFPSRIQSLKSWYSLCAY